MSYHVSIIRSQSGKRGFISKREVYEYIDTVNELSISEDNYGNLLISYKKLGEDNHLIMWQEGEIWSKSPDKLTLQLMIDIANNLGARVCGDELESYISPTETYIHQDDQAEYSARNRQKKYAKWDRVYRAIMGRIVVVAFFVFLGLIAKLVFNF